jgi:hypothetical protein
MLNLYISPLELFPVLFPILKLGIVLTGLILLLLWLSERKEKRDKYYIELAQRYSFGHESVESIRKRFKSNPELFKEAKKLYSQEMEQKRERERIRKETNRKEGIIKRVLAYDYEELLFQIFATYATEKFCLCPEWASSALTKGQILDKISEIKAISEDEAEKIFNVLREHHLIFKLSDGFYLDPMLEKRNTLSSDGYPSWDIVSNMDMNLDKWMVAHGYKHTKKD